MAVTLVGLDVAKNVCSLTRAAIRSAMGNVTSKGRGQPDTQSLHRTWERPVRWRAFLMSPFRSLIVERGFTMTQGHERPAGFLTCQKSLRSPKTALPGDDRIKPEGQDSLRSRAKRLNCCHRMLDLLTLPSGSTTRGKSVHQKNVVVLNFKRVRKRFAVNRVRSGLWHSGRSKSSAQPTGNFP